MRSHFPHGNEHVITCLARLFLASCTALELIHEPRNSRLSPSLSKNSAAQVVAAGWANPLHPVGMLCGIGQDATSNRSENIMSERRALASQQRTNGGKSNLPHALSVSWNSMQDRRQCVQAEERVPGNKMSIIAKHGAPEPRISDDSLPGIHHLSRMRVKQKGLTGTSAMA
jgi:hypothetical protein